MHKFEIIKEEIKKILEPMDIDEMLPTYIQLTDRFNVSEITVRKALMDLQNEGYIYAKRRQGMYKARPKRTIKDIYLILGFLISDPNFINEFYPGIIIQVQSELYKRDIDCVFAFHNDNPSLEEHIINRAKSRDFYGIIINPSGDKSNIQHYKELYKYNQNMVFIDNNLGEDIGNFVKGSSIKTAKLMAEKFDYSDIEKVYIINECTERLLMPCIERISSWLEVLEKNKFKKYEIISDKRPFENCKYDIVHRLRKDMKNYKKIGFFTINCSWANFLVNELREDFKELDRIDFLTFGQMYAEIPDNFNGYWAKNNTEKMAKKIADIIERKDEKKETVEIEYTIENIKN